MEERNTLVFASFNQGKVNEYQSLFHGSSITIKSFLDFEDTPVIHETGQNFSDNAQIKARAAADFYGMPAFGEDSGLEVYALEGAPGVYSKRYAGDHCSDKDNIDKLLRNLKDIPSDQREARFRAVICLSIPLSSGVYKDYFFEGECEGLITTEPRGVGGFGYDPIFLSPSTGMTFSEVGEEVTNTLSHRKKAADQLLQFLDENDPFKLMTEH